MRRWAAAWMFLIVAPCFAESPPDVGALTERVLNREEPLEPAVAPHLDACAMARLALGDHWGRASRAQRLAFAERFEQLMIRRWSRSLDGRKTGDAGFLPYREGARAIATLELVDRRGEAVTVDYRLLRRGDRPWKIYDILVQGESLVTRHRERYARRIERRGLDALIAAID